MLLSAVGGAKRGSLPHTPVCMRRALCTDVCATELCTRVLRSHVLWPRTCATQVCAAELRTRAPQSVCTKLVPQSHVP